MRIRSITFIVLLTLLLGLAVLPWGKAPLHAEPAPETTSAVAGEASDASQSQSPVMFIENVGQFNEGARFQVRGAGATLWLADDALWMTVLEPVEPSLTAPSRPWDQPEPDVPAVGVNLRLSFVGTNPQPTLEPFQPVDTTISYFYGNDPDGWHADVPVWAGVRYRDLYPGIDLELGSGGGRFQPRLIVREGANLDAVRLRVEGADAVNVNMGESALQLVTAAGDVAFPLMEVVNREGAPVGELAEAAVQAGVVRAPFAAGPRTVAGKMMAESGLLFATFLGGSSRETGIDIEADDAGNAYVIGWTESDDFPTTVGVFDPSPNGLRDIFVSKLDTVNGVLVYSSYLGSYGPDQGNAITIDDSGNVYVTGSAWGNDFPITPNAADQDFAGASEAFVTKLNSNGSQILYSTYLGGDEEDNGYGLTVDESGATYIVGNTHSNNFPHTDGAYDTTYNGGSYGDGFVTKLAADGSTLEYSTFLGGNSGFYSGEYARGIAIDSTGAALVTGDTGSTNFPVTPGAWSTTLNGPFDAYVTKIDPSGSNLVFSTFLGGEDSEGGHNVLIHDDGKIYVSGSTDSEDFPIAGNAIFPEFDGGIRDGYIAVFSGDGAVLTYSTFLGGDNSDYISELRIGSENKIHVSGNTDSEDFPLTPNALPLQSRNGDLFITVFSIGNSELHYSTLYGGYGDESGGEMTLGPSGEVYIIGSGHSHDLPIPSVTIYPSEMGNGDAIVAKLLPLANSLHLPVVRR